MAIPPKRPSARTSSASPESASSRRSYSLHPLAALDGVYLYVTAGGESVGFYFGKTERAVAELAAADLIAAEAGSHDPDST
jgi:hypothetical protein